MDADAVDGADSAGAGSGFDGTKPVWGAGRKE